MKYFLLETNEKNPIYTMYRYDEYVGSPNEAELEFWLRIQKLELALTEISNRTRRPSERIGGAAQIVLSAEQMAEIAEKALATS